MDHTRGVHSRKVWIKFYHRGLQTQTLLKTTDLILGPRFVSFRIQSKVIFQTNLVELDFFGKKVVGTTNVDSLYQTFTVF